MFPSSLRPNKLAACSVLSNTNEVVWYIGTARAFVEGSGTCPPCRAFVPCPGMISPVSVYNSNITIVILKISLLNLLEVTETAPNIITIVI